MSKNFINFLPDKDSETSNEQQQLQHEMKCPRLPYPLRVENLANLQHLANVDPSKLLDSTEPDPKLQKSKKMLD